MEPKGCSVPRRERAKKYDYRYEKGDIEKVPFDSLAELAKILQTTPAYLMCW